MESKFKVYFTPEAQQDLENLPKFLKKKILKRIYWLRDNLSKVKLTPLYGNLASFYKLRFGDYRILYKLDFSHQQIIIYVIKHRKDVYR